MYEIEFSQGVRDKAARMIATGRVTRVPRQFDLWEVVGDAGTYRVRINPEWEREGQFKWATCGCAWADRNTGLIPGCSHALAAIELARVVRTCGLQLVIA